MKATLWVVLSGMMIVAALRADEPKVVTVLKGLDPVALIDGKEVPGLEDQSVVRGRHRYLFASAQSKQMFEKAPEQYAVQIGGACAKMGPLSGLGSPDRFHVHDRKIFLFASDSCRNSFKAAPEKFVDKADEPPRGTAEEIERGTALVLRAVEGFGAAEKVDAVKTYRAVAKLAYKQQNQTTEGGKTVTYSFPGCCREDNSWGTWRGADVLTPNGGLRISGKEVAPVDDSVCRYMEREFYRMPLAILKARNEPGFRAVSEGNGKIGDADVEFAKVGYKGATTILAVESKTGRVIQASYRGRASTGITDVVKAYSDFRDVNGVMVPFVTEVRSDGKVQSNPVVTVETITINEKLEPAVFKLSN